MGKPPAVLDQINLISSDLSASLAFYRRLGVEFPEERVWRTATGAHHATAAEGEGAGLDLDSAPFARIWNQGWMKHGNPAGRTVIGFRLPARSDVDARYAELIAAGYKGLQPPYDAFWGSRYGIIEDPDGIAVGLMSPADPEFRSRPPEV